MKFTEHELTTALTGAAKTVLAASSGTAKSIRKGETDIDQMWNGLSRFQRYTVLDKVGDQVLPVMVALPDIEVEAGTKPTFTDEQVAAAVAETSGDGAGGRLRRATHAKATTALVKVALNALPVRQDPDALIVPDHL